MRRMLIICGVLVAFLFVVKLLVLAGMVKQAGASGGLFTIGQANAEPTVKVGERQIVDVLDDSLASERKLADQLLEKQKQLEARESIMKSEEAKLGELKKEITAKIDSLRALEEKLSVPLAAEDKKFKELAKVYEAAPPAQVGSILEKMDKKTAAAIIMNMNIKKAGAVWGHMKPDKSVEIAREVANAGR